LIEKLRAQINTALEEITCVTPLANGALRLGEHVHQRIIELTGGGDIIYAPTYKKSGQLYLPEDVMS